MAGWRQGQTGCQTVVSDCTFALAVASFPKGCSEIAAVTGTTRRRCKRRAAQPGQRRRPLFDVAHVHILQPASSIVWRVCKGGHHVDAVGCFKSCVKTFFVVESNLPGSCSKNPQCEFAWMIG